MPDIKNIADKADIIYHNERATHLSALWGIVNWEEIAARYIFKKF